MLQFKHKKNEKNVQIVQREVRMKKLLYRPKDAWVGDLIPYYENGTFYGYYLHDPRIRDKEYAEETTWHLVTTKDFVNVEYKGEAIKKLIGVLIIMHHNHFRHLMEEELWLHGQMNGNGCRFLKTGDRLTGKTGADSLIFRAKLI